ncbi:BTAD domain-containing putative transcriptional regulator [Streptomyces sp. NPDC047525]|uniref:AfsR/SARP family transcriptional regulator n=1 Tax=Streptomyces sp. NPDC047525 TaxID=3155264 RepID=UPI0033E1E8CF
MRFEVLGPLTVRTADGAVVPVPEPKVRALLANLLIHQGRPVPADVLIDGLWGERLPGNPANSLQTKISQLRRALEKAEPGARELVAYGPAGYLLRAPEGVAPEELTDAARFVALTSRAYDANGTHDTFDARTRVSLLSEALTLWSGPAYADFRDAEFVRVAVARLEEQRLTAQEVRAELRLDLAAPGEHAALADELADLVAEQPLRERLRGAYMRALYLAGRPTEALDAYRDLRERLADDLGMDPGAELAALQEAMLRQSPELASPGAEGRPPRTEPSEVAQSGPETEEPHPRTNLPAPVTALVGREDAVSRVRDLVGASRLVTLTGPGGVGKTRLAVEAAAGLTDDFEEGVWLVELAGTKGDVAETVAATLGIRDDPSLIREEASEGTREGTPEPNGSAATASAERRPSTTNSAFGAGQALGSGQAPGPRYAPGAGPAPDPRHTPTLVRLLARALAPRRLLLVLDNCEHVLEQVAALLSELLRHAPELRVLATSQEPLALAGETLEAVAPLAEGEALALFAERAAAAAPGFVLDAESTPAAALICRRLDGIPLAIELAATRVRALGVHALADRLHDRFRLLNQVRRDAPARQRTLRAMIDWSWELLTVEEQGALRQLAVFGGGFTLDSAEAVYGIAPGSFTPGSFTPCGTAPGGFAPAGSAPGGSAPGSFTHGSFTPCGTAPGGFAPAGSAPGGSAPGSSAHGDAADVLDLVTRLVDRSLLTATTPKAADRTHGIRYRMLESVTAYSLERLDEAGETKDVRRRHAHHYADLAERAAPQLLGPGQQQWLHRLDSEAVNLRTALEWAQAEGDAALALRLANSLTWYWFLRGRLGEAERSLTLALSLPPSGETATVTATARPRASARTARAALALLTGDDAPYTDIATDADVEGADLRSRWLLAYARCGFDRTRSEETQVDALLEEFRAADDRWGVAAALSTRATRALYRGDLATLRRDAEASAALFAGLGDRWGQLQASEQLGVLAEIAADYEGAARLHRDGMRGAEELQLWTDVSFRLARLGRIALLTGDDAAATDFHERAARLAAQHSHGPAQQFAETGLAIGARRLGELDAAEKYLQPWLAWNRRLGVHSGTALILAQLGYVAEQRGDAARAEELHREGLTVARGTGDERAVAQALEGLAGARSLAHDHTRAAELLGSAAALREATGSPLPQAERFDVDRAARRSRTALGEDGYAAAYTRGHDAPAPDPADGPLTSGPATGD